MPAELNCRVRSRRAANVSLAVADIVGLVDRQELLKDERNEEHGYALPRIRSLTNPQNIDRLCQ